MRAVEVLCDCGPGSQPRWLAGSGYLVGGRWVLTAAHNVDYLQVVPDGRLLVRRMGAGRAELAAQVVVAGTESADLALLEVTDPAFVEALTPVSWARVNRGRPEILTGCWAVGCPAFKQRKQADAPSGWLIDTEQVAGQIRPGSDLQSGLLSLQVTSAPRLLPEGSLAQSEWAGMSGAAVFVADPFRGQVAVGVVIEHLRPEGVSSLTLLPVTALTALLAGQTGRGAAARDELRIDDPGRWLDLPRPQSRPAPYYRETISGFAARTPVLLNRGEELAELIAFSVTGTEGYRWLIGSPWAGKTALVAHLLIACPPQVDWVAYFLNHRAMDADSDRFTAVINAQLAWLLEEQPPPASENRDAFPGLWGRACDRAQQLGRPLLLVVDGLDEDLGPTGAVKKVSVAALLPQTAGGYCHVLVTSRPLLRLPTDVSDEHPLRRTDPIRLRPSDAAQEIQQRAETELSQLIEDADQNDPLHTAASVCSQPHKAPSRVMISPLCSHRTAASSTSDCESAARSQTRSAG